MNTLIALSLFLFMLASSVSATPLLITGGTFREGIGGIRYDFVGETFSAVGTESIGMTGVLNGVTYVHADLLTFQIEPLADDRVYTFTGLLNFSKPGDVQNRLEVAGVGLGTLAVFGAGVSTFSLTFANPTATLSAMPEPSTWILLCSGLAVLIWRRGRSTG